MPAACATGILPQQTGTYIGAGCGRKTANTFLTPLRRRPN